MDFFFFKLNIINFMILSILATGPLHLAVENIQMAGDDFIGIDRLSQCSGRLPRGAH